MGLRQADLAKLLGVSEMSGVGEGAASAFSDLRAETQRDSGS